MHHRHDRPEPPEHVLRAFGAVARPTPLAGGQGLAWRSGGLVLKPADTSEEALAWQAATLGRANGRRVRVATPHRSTHGGFVVGGWMASVLCPGSQQRRRWLEIIAVGDRLHAALAGVERPAFLQARADPWAVADRAAWGEMSLAPYRQAPHVARLGALLAPVDAPSQVIHGDLTGNVLFADALPPAVIDFAIYWRPPAYASAIVVADALAWEGALVKELVSVSTRPGFGQFLTRALLFRIITDWLTDADDALARGPAYSSGVDLAASLIDPGNPEAQRFPGV